MALLVAMAGGVHAESITRTSAFEYDSISGLLVKEIVEPGSSTLCLVTIHGYDNFGNRNSQTTRNCNGSVGSSPGNNSEAAAPAAGDPALFVARGNSVVYSGTGRFPVTSTNALGQVETKTYEPTSLGAPTQLTGPNGLSTFWKADGFGRQVLEKRADGNGSRTSYKYCNSVAVNGVPGTEVCPTIAGAVGVYVATTTPVKTPIDMAAGTDGGANGPYSRAYYDILGRVIRKETQGWDGAVERLVYQDTEYNTRGQVVRSSNPYFAGASTINWVVTTYDWIGRALTVTQPDGSKSKSTYQGLTISVTDDLGRVTTQTRNEADRVVRITDPKAKTLTKTYSAHGDLLTSVDSRGNVIKLTYDLRGRKIEQVDPDMGRWTYGYNALGELLTQTDAKNQISRMTYDRLGRLVAKTQPSLITNWYYDKYKDNSVCTKGVGKLCESTASNGYSRREYFDSLGRPSSTTSIIGATSYTGSVSYNSDGRMDAVVYPSGRMSLQNQYTSLGFLYKLVDAWAPTSVYWTALGVDADGHITSQRYGNTVVTTNTYEPLTGRLKQTVAGAGNALQNVSYTYDTIGNLKTRSDVLSGVNATYTYDSLNRMETELRQGGGLASAQTVTWLYDELGNISSRSDVGTYAYNPSGATSVRPHAVTGVTGIVNGQSNPIYTYDANGNLSSVKVGAATLRSVTWNSYNKADSISQTLAGTTNKLDFLYDSEGDRVREVFSKNGAVQRTTVYLNDGGLAYETETVAGVTTMKHYLSAAGGTIGVFKLTGGTDWKMQYWHKDHLGSPMVVTDGTGVLVERMAYEPFGKRRNTNGTTDANGTLTAVSTRRGFTGHEHDDEVGLVNMNGRVFDQAIGRFLSADPTIQSSVYMQSYNRYAYMWNSPLNGTDPSGYTNFFTNLMNWSDQSVYSSLALSGHFTGAYAAKYLLTGPYGYQVKSVGLGVVSVFCNAWVYVCLAASEAALAKSYGASNSDAVQAGAIAAASAYALNAVGSATQGEKLANGTRASMSGMQKLGNVAGHAAVGCASAAASGGDCRSGALSGGFSSAFTNFGPNMKGNKVLGTISNAVVGGAGSVIGGGKFENGAVGGAFGYLFNHLMHIAGGQREGTNPFGHSAMAVEGAGMFSYGNSTPVGSDPLAYITAQSQLRDQLITVIPTTPAQDAAALKFYGQNPEMNGIGLIDNCSVRSSGALGAAGVKVSGSPFPGGLARQTSTLPGAQNFYIPKGGAIPQGLTDIVRQRFTAPSIPQQ